MPSERSPYKIGGTGLIMTSSLRERQPAVFRTAGCQKLLKLRIVPPRVSRSEGKRASICAGDMNGLQQTSLGGSKMKEKPARPGPRPPADGEVRGRASDPAFRRVRARLAAQALHAKRPNLASEAGRKGGLSTSRRYHLGEKAWATAMSLKRWHKSPFNYASRAPKAGSGADTDGTVEPDPATAPPPDTNSGEKT